MIRRRTEIAHSLVPCLFWGDRQSFCSCFCFTSFATNVNVFSTQIRWTPWIAVVRITEWRREDQAGPGRRRTDTMRNSRCFSFASSLLFYDIEKSFSTSNASGKQNETFETALGLLCPAALSSPFYPNISLVSVLLSQPLLISRYWTWKIMKKKYTATVFADICWDLIGQFGAYT